MQDRRDRCVLLIGTGRAVERYDELYSAAGYCRVDRVSPVDWPGSGQVYHLVHIVDTGLLRLPELAEPVAALGAPVALPFWPGLPLAELERFVVHCESCDLRLMLAYPPLYGPAFHKLLHAVSTGLVGTVERVELRLPGGAEEFRRGVSSGPPMAPACVGLAFAALLLDAPVTWESWSPGAATWSSTTAAGIEVRVCSAEGGSGAEFAVAGSASTLLLSADGGTHRLRARRGDVEKELDRFEQVDLYCATTKAAGLFLDNRTRNVIPGHTGLLLGRVFEAARKALLPPAPVEPRPPQHEEALPPGPPPRYDLYRKRHGRPGKDPVLPIWEAKFNIEAACNQDCLFCFARDDDLQLTDLAGSPELLGRLTAEGVEGVMFSGREPTLNHSLPEYIAMAKAAGMRNVTVETNALLFADMPLVRRCREAGLDSAFVSFHSARAETVALLTRTEDSFERTLQGIRNLIEAGVDVELNCVINRHNYQELEEVARFVAEQLPEVSAITFSFVAPLGRAWKERAAVPRIAEAAPYLARALVVAEESGIDAMVHGRCGIPICLLPGLERFFVDYRLRDVKPGSGAVDSPDRHKEAACRECRFDAHCQGLWSNYVSLFGAAEIARGFQLVNPEAAGPEREA